MKYLVGVVCKWLSDGLAGKVCVYAYTHTCMHTDRRMCIESRRGQCSDVVTAVISPWSCADVHCTGFHGFHNFLTLQREAGWGRWEGQCLRPAGVASCGENVRAGAWEGQRLLPGTLILGEELCLLLLSVSQGASVWDYSFFWAVSPQRRALAGVVSVSWHHIDSVLWWGTGLGALAGASISNPGHTWRVFLESVLS